MNDKEKIETLLDLLNEIKGQLDQECCQTLMDASIFRLHNFGIYYLVLILIDQSLLAILMISYLAHLGRC